jgi:predicted NUDIX family NTP pyrophosphohydrolase
MTTDKSGRTSAGILLWRRRDDRLEVLLAHQGGPYWVNKDLGHWTIPKGEVEEGEELVAVARREFAEETGYELPDTPLIELGEIRQKSGKLVLAWAARGDLDAATAVSNTYQMEWPPRSGRVETFPEIDRVEWFKLTEARRKLKAAQVPFLDRLQTAIAADRSPPTPGDGGLSGSTIVAGSCQDHRGAARHPRVARGSGRPTPGG